jgi:hypothetical protein
MVLGILIGAIFVGATIALTLACYFLMRWMSGNEHENHERDLASSVVFRVSALHGLILALVFAQEMFSYQQLRLQTATEANAIADIYFDAGRYGHDEKVKVQKELSDYIRVVIDKEWHGLGETNRLSPEAWAQWDESYRAILDLVPTNPRQQSLRGHMLDRIYLVSESRTKRESTVADSLNGIFWFAAISGVIFIAVAYYSYPPTHRNIILISLFGAYTGVILFLIYAFSNPYIPPAELSPGPFLRLQEQIAASLPPGQTAPQ